MSDEVKETAEAILQGIVFEIEAEHLQVLARAYLDQQDLVALIKETLDDHNNPESPFYNDCHPGQECSWCETALKVLGQAKEGE